MDANEFLREIADLELDELMERRAAIDAALEEKRKDLLKQAERVDDLIGNGKKRRGRKPKREQEPDDGQS